ncbi:MAG: hypothetical protein GXX96_01590 [Planctomycetaceae bacterium]|nr:hypothetical protein [Planctomycetaceae bacterium]
MNLMPTLQRALTDVLYETKDEALRLIVGGGYGIYLKREYVRDNGIRTLLREWPEAQSTNDLDLFLPPELLVDSARLKPLGSALQRLGYKVIRGAEKFQFAKLGPDGGQAGSLKIDLLTGPRSSFAGTSARVDERRVRPRPSVDVHAHPVDEALTLEEGLLPLTLHGVTSGGIAHDATVYVPHPLTFTMMKLFAFRDRLNDESKDFARYHALDIYTVLATTTEKEWDEALELSETYHAAPVVIEAAQVVKDHFAGQDSLGMLRLRESPYARPELQLGEFLDALQELLLS